MVFLKLTEQHYTFDNGTEKMFTKIMYINMYKVIHITYYNSDIPSKGSNLYYDGEDEKIVHVKESPMEIMKALKSEIKDNNRIERPNTGPGI